MSRESHNTWLIATIFPTYGRWMFTKYTSNAQNLVRFEEADQPVPVYKSPAKSTMAPALA